MLLRDILCGGVWNGFLLGESKEEEVLCRYCGDVDGGHGHLLWDCQYPPLVRTKDDPEFAALLVVSIVVGLGAWPGVAGLPCFLTTDN